ncbi:hypothetical protein [Hymenobacter weizhouensis]|uniref:hypothetical protein n=1 Tax=Hymenobacter sp. YIM 151500-1 TaxID=2987689 RepID=UPI002226E8B1|nr:hypothetical protein [Hymenobacter sp. YIM 151500-1]UYZ64410.1 hypothetical protein OIS53_06045 [Hymenobacter sp. YIM 151500-1]
MSQQEELSLASILNEYDNMLNNTSKSVGIELQIKQESSLVKRVYEEIQWRGLPDESKQEKRRAALSILEKWSFEDGKQDSLVYERSIVSLYDSIEKVLSQQLPTATLFLRIKAILLIERIFINEKRDLNSIRHMDYYIWENVFKEAQCEHNNIFEEIGLDAVNKHFTAMYRAWPKRPYKDL